MKIFCLCIISYFFMFGCGPGVVSNQDSGFTVSASPRLYIDVSVLNNFLWANIEVIPQDQPFDKTKNLQNLAQLHDEQQFVIARGYLTLESIPKLGACNGAELPWKGRIDGKFQKGIDSFVSEFNGSLKAPLSGCVIPVIHCNIATPLKGIGKSLKCVASQEDI